MGVYSDPVARVPGCRALLAGTLFAGLAGAYLFATSTQAADAHVHGEAVLEASVSATELLVSLRGPAQVFYGFEHPPSTAQEAAAIQRAVALLRAPEEGILAVDAGCSVDRVTLVAPFARQAQEWVGDADGVAHDQAHHDGHKSLEDHERDADHAHHDEAGGHVDIEADYVFRCAAMPSRLTVVAFAGFPALEQVEAAWISETAAGSERLDVQSPTLQFGRR